jgi:inactive STAND
MNWEEFLIVKAHRVDLKPAARRFVVKHFQDEQSLDLPVLDLARNYHMAFSTCTRHRTDIFRAFGESESQKNNDKLKPLYSRLRQEFDRDCAQKAVRGDIPKPTAEQLHHLLRQFNYCTQERSIQDSLLPAAAFLVRIDELVMQQWLVWRLLQVSCERMVDEKPRCLTVSASGKWAAQPDIFWGWLSGELELEAQTPENLLESIAHLCRNRSVIFVIQELDMVKPATQDFLLNQFWTPLADRLEAQYQLGYGKCQLFLTGAADYEWKHSIATVDPLEPWSRVSVARDMRPWLENGPVLNFLCQATEQLPQDLEKEWLQGSTSRGKPKAVIKQLGQDVGLEDGIEEMKPYWQLAA